MPKTKPTTLESEVQRVIESARGELAEVTRGLLLKSIEFASERAAELDKQASAILMQRDTRIGQVLDLLGMLRDELTAHPDAPAWLNQKRAGGLTELCWRPDDDANAYNLAESTDLDIAEALVELQRASLEIRGRERSAAFVKARGYGFGMRSAE